MKIDCPISFLQMLKEGRVRLNLVKVAFKKLVYYFLNATMIVFGQALSSFRLYVSDFARIGAYHKNIWKFISNS